MKPGKQSERSMLISMKFPGVIILEKWNRSEEISSHNANELQRSSVQSGRDSTALL
jgi:hypothetical protein